MLPRAEVMDGFSQEMENFADLVRSLKADEWAQPSRCEGWTVGDVAAHLVGALADVAAGRLEGQGTPEVSARQVAERTGHPPGAVADELLRVGESMKVLMTSLDDAAWAGPVPGLEFTVGQGMESLWCGTYVHADDIRAAIRRPSARGPGLRASVHHVADLLTNRGWGPAILELDGIEEVVVGDVSGGSGTRRVTGDPLAFLLVATGRADPTVIGLDAGVNVFN